MRQSELFEDIYISTLPNGHLEVFRNGIYLFNVISKYDLFDKEDYFTIFYDKSFSETRFGVLNRKLEVVIPQILEYAIVTLNKQILYRIDGKYGVWNDNLFVIIPPIYDHIKCVENFYIAGKDGGFPNLFWDNCQGCCYGNKQSETSECLIFQHNGDIAWKEDVFENIYPKFKHIIDLKGICYDAKIGVCYQLTNNKIKYGVINSDGRYIVPPTHDYLKIIVEEETLDRKYEPKVLIYGIGGATKLGVVRGVNKYIHTGGQYGLLSLENNVIIPAIYDGISVYGDYVRVRKGTSFGLYNIKGDILLDTVYSAVNFVEIDRKTQIVVFNIGGNLIGDITETDKYYSFGVKGFRPTPFSSSWHPRWEDIKITIEGGMWGYYNLTTKKKSNQMYKEVSSFNKGFACVKIENEFYLIDSDFHITEGPYLSKADALSYLDY